MSGEKRTESPVPLSFLSLFFPYCSSFRELCWFTRHQFTKSPIDPSLVFIQSTAMHTGREWKKKEKKGTQPKTSCLQSVPGIGDRNIRSWKINFSETTKQRRTEQRNVLVPKRNVAPLPLPGIFLTKLFISVKRYLSMRYFFLLAKEADYEKKKRFKQLFVQQAKLIPLIFFCGLISTEPSLWETAGIRIWRHFRWSAFVAMDV